MSDKKPYPTAPIAYEFGKTLATLEGKELETTFLAAVIPHHFAAIEMSQLELERGESVDIRTHAENIIAQQQHQVEQFTRWLKEWYELTPEEAKGQTQDETQALMTKMAEHDHQDATELSKVEGGEGFDRAFVQRMIPHHQSAVVVALELQTRSVHPQLHVAATASITEQQTQIAGFRTWLLG